MMKILFYGFRHGHINTLYQKVMESPLACVAGCVEENTEARENAIKKLGATFSDRSYEEWLSTDIDAVAIGGAYGDRGEAVIRALEAGKHILADKPLCTDVRQLERIRALSREKNLKVFCMLDLRDLPQVTAAKNILDGGSLGEVRNVSFNGQHCLNYGSRPGWYFEPGKHGGTVNDLAIHGIDLVRMLTGMEFTSADAVRTWNAYAHLHPDFKDCALLMARLENGAGVLADISYSAPSQAFSMPSYWEFRIWCDRGMLTFNYRDAFVTVFEEGADTPTRIEGIPAPMDYLERFVAEVNAPAERSETESVLRSTETALWLQQQAEEARA